MANRQSKKLIISMAASGNAMSACDVQTAEAILAKLVARAYAADHTALFGPCLNPTIGGSSDEE